MQTLKFTDGTSTIEIVYFTAVTGLGLPPVEITANTIYGKDGAVIKSVKYQPRPFTMAFDIRKRGAGAAAAAIAERRAITRFFADKQPKTFIYNRDGWEVYLYPVYLASAFDTQIDEIRILNTSLQFISSNPYFQKNIGVTYMSMETPLLEWPEAGFEYPEDGIEYSTAEQRMSVESGADVISPAFVRFIGPAVSPYVENTTTGERIEVNRTLAEGDTLEINTEAGTVVIVDSEGDRHNAFNYITGVVQFINLKPGENIIEFGHAGGSLGYIGTGGKEYYGGI